MKNRTKKKEKEKEKKRKKATCAKGGAGESFGSKFRLSMPWIRIFESASQYKESLIRLIRLPTPGLQRIDDRIKVDLTD